MSVPPEQVDTIILDLDGTLVDSVYEHVRAWMLAFHRVGLDVEGTRIHHAIGMGGDRLVAAVADERVEQAVGEELRRLHDEIFWSWIADVRPLRGASELLQRIDESGLTAVLASSSPPEHVDRMLESVDDAHLLATVVTGEDADSTKPSPEIIEVALGKVGSGRALAVGDAVWDVESAGRAGIGCIGVRTGGICDVELREAGAIEVFDGPAELADRLKEVVGPQR